MTETEHTYARPTGFLIALYLAVIVGLLGLGATVVYGQSGNNSTKDLVEDNAVLLKRLERLERESSISVENHRVRNEILHADICRMMFDITRQVPSLEDVQPCTPSIVNGDGKVDPAHGNPPPEDQ